MDDDLNRFRQSLEIAVGRVWPVALINDNTGERIRKPMFNSVTAERLGTVIRVRGEFFDGFARVVAVPENVALASSQLAANDAIKRLKNAYELNREVA